MLIAWENNFIKQFLDSIEGWNVWAISLISITLGTDLVFNVREGVGGVAFQFSWCESVVFKFGLNLEPK